MESSYPIFKRLDENTLVIYNKLIKATSLWQFRGSSGSRILEMPYWIYGDGGKLMLPSRVTESTSIEELEKGIKAGIIYIREVNVKLARENHLSREIEL
jgi:hypothetical protein